MCVGVCERERVRERETIWTLVIKISSGHWNVRKAASTVIKSSTKLRSNLFIYWSIWYWRIWYNCRCYMSGWDIEGKKYWIDELKVESEYWTILKQYSLNINTATATGYQVYSLLFTLIRYYVNAHVMFGSHLKRGVDCKHCILTN